MAPADSDPRRADRSAEPLAERTVLLASPRGFCAGVDRAIEIVERALAAYGPPVYVRHEIVHNQHVVSELAARGAVFIENPEEVPPGAHLVFSAHGVSPAVRAQAQAQALHTIDATCPLVTKVHVEAQQRTRQGCEIILIGHRGHVEVEGTLGHAPDSAYLVETVEDAERIEVRDPERLALLTQTTLSVDDTREIAEVLRRRFPAIRVPSKDDICYATQNRQNAIKAIAARAQFILVVGSASSSNSNRLVEVARAHGAAAKLVASAAEIDPQWVRDVTVVGITAGASTPDLLVQGVVARLAALGIRRVEELRTAEEDVHFSLPAELREPSRRPS
jgi:4-hydroxy-3-methylbut-2-enyl diphosphate reductase